MQDSVAESVAKFYNTGVVKKLFINLKNWHAKNCLDATKEVHTSQVKATSILFLILYKVGYTQKRKTNHFGIQVKSEAN